MRAALWTLGRWGAADAAPFALQRTPVHAHAVAASVSHALVACEDHVLAVGENGAGELGTPPDPTRWWTHTLPGRATHLAAGAHFSWLGTRDALRTCGTGVRGQRGGVRADPAPTPTDAPSADEVHAGLDHVVLRAHRDVYTCGRTSDAYAVNTDGQLGRADAGRFDAALRRVAMPPARLVRAGGDTSLALATDGRVFVWGNTEYGQAGLDGDQLRVPTAAPFAIPAVDARVGGSFVLFQTGTYAREDALVGTTGRDDRRPTARRVPRHAAGPG